MSEHRLRIFEEYRPAKRRVDDATWWRLISLTEHWGVESRVYDAKGNLRIRKVFAPGEERSIDIPEDMGKGPIKLVNRALYFDEDGRPDWTILYHDVHRHGWVIPMNTDPDAPKESPYDATEALQRELEAGLPEPWDPQPIEGDWKLRRRGLTRPVRRRA